MLATTAGCIPLRHPRRQVATSHAVSGGTPPVRPHNATRKTSQDIVRHSTHHSALSVDEWWTMAIGVCGVVSNWLERRASLLLTLCSMPVCHQFPPAGIKQHPSHGDAPHARLAGTRDAGRAAHAPRAGHHCGVQSLDRHMRCAGTTHKGHQRWTTEEEERGNNSDSIGATQRAAVESRRMRCRLTLLPLRCVNIPVLCVIRTKPYRLGRPSWCSVRPRRSRPARRPSDSTPCTGPRACG